MPGGGLTRAALAVTLGLVAVLVITGVVLTFEKGPEFEPGGDKPSMYHGRLLPPRR